MLVQFFDVADFHEAYGQPIAYKPTVLANERAALRHSLLQEEVNELRAAMLAGNHHETLDGIIDCMYILFGTAIECGLDLITLTGAWREVHASNMSKLDENGKPIYRADGKILKGANYFKPDLKGIIYERYADAYETPETN